MLIDEWPISFFNGSYYWLSNFSPYSVQYDSFMFPTVEHGFQAMKATDATAALAIINARTPREAKRLGRQVLLRPDWEDAKIDVMRLLVRLKFEQHSDIATKLLATGNRKLVEGNYWHDTFWGQCVCSQHHNSGQNHLGLILMYTRHLLRSKEQEGKDAN